MSVIATKISIVHEKSGVEACPFYGEPQHEMFVIPAENLIDMISVWNFRMVQFKNYGGRASSEVPGMSIDDEV